MWGRRAGIEGDMVYMTESKIVSGYGFGQYFGRVRGVGDTLEAAFSSARSQAEELGAHAVVDLESSVDLETLQWSVQGSAARLIDRGWISQGPTELWGIDFA